MMGRAVGQTDSFMLILQISLADSKICYNSTGQLYSRGRRQTATYSIVTGRSGQRIHL